MLVTAGGLAGALGGGLPRYPCWCLACALAVDLDGALAGAAITVNGTATGETVTVIAAGELTASGTLDVANGDVLGFAFAGAPVTIDRIRVDDADLAAAIEAALRDKTVNFGGLTVSEHMPAPSQHPTSGGSTPESC